MPLRSLAHTWRYISYPCYFFGTLCTLLVIALLLRISFYIACKAPPLAALSFLPVRHTPLLFLCLLGIMAAAIAFWQAGATYRQKYDALSQQRTYR